MNLWVLDENLDAIDIIDTYTSLIWTDRYREYGDFEIYTPMTDTILNTVKQDRYLWREDSEHVMIIEKILIESDAEDGDRLTTTGRSLESILDRRVIWGLKTLSGNFQNGVKELLNDCIINPSKPERKIPNFIFVESSDPAITELTIEAQFTGDNLYDVIRSLCEERNLGFKVTLTNSKKFAFSLYFGEDRSYDQFTNPYVVFSPKFDNIINSNYVESKSALKNVTLVGGEGKGSARRYTAVGNTAGLSRREIFTDANDVSSTDSTDLTELFDFTEYPNEAFDYDSNSFVTDSNFNSAKANVGEYAGRTISISVPKYTGANATAQPYALILIDENKQMIEILQKWEDNGTTANSGSLSTYEILLPSHAKYIYATMYSQAAIDADHYYGDLDDFSCQSIKISNVEYINLLRQRGTETLAENQEVVSFEGEADTTTMFKYGVDFFAGDIVSVADSYGHETKARVVEVVTSENEDGSSSTYPTFSTIKEIDTSGDDESVLPEGFTQVSFLRSTGTQYIDTNFKPSSNTRIVCQVNLAAQTTATWLFGARTSQTQDAFGFLTYQNGYRSDFVSAGGNISAMYGPNFLLDKNRGATYMDGTLIETRSESAFSCGYNLFIFANNTAGTVAGYSSADLVYMEIYEDDILVRDFIPCVNEDGVAGLYDTVDSIFYTNAGTGEFITG